MLLKWSPIRLLMACAMLLTTVGCSTDPKAKRQQFVESGDRYVAENKFAEATIQYRNAVQVDPTSGETRKKLAEVYVKTGDGPHALEEFVRAADLLPQDVDVQLKAGTFLLLARKSEDALGRADAVLKLQPANVQAHLLRGNALAGLRSFEEALKAIEEAIRLDPARGSTFAQLGTVQMARGRQSDAEVAFKKAVELSPDSVEAHLALGNFYWSTGRAKETEEAFTGALRAQPDNGPANRALAAFAIATGRYRDAEPYLRRLADSSKDPSATIALADYYLASGRSQDAIARLEALQKAGQDTPVVGQRLARAYAASGQTDKANVLLRQVLSRTPTAVDAKILQAQLLLKDGKRDDALTELKSAATSNPSSAEAQFALGQVYAARGDVEAASAAYRQVLTLNPRANAARVEIARLQLATGKIQDSVRSAEEATKGEPRNVAARLGLVRSLIASKDYVRAERELATLQSALPNVGAVYVQEGVLALLKGDLPRARRALDRAQTLEPKSLDVLSALLAADFKAGDVNAAKARIEKRLSEETSGPLLMVAAKTYMAARDPVNTERVLRAAIEADPTNLQPYSMLGQLYVSQKKLDEARKEFESLAARQVRPIGPLTMVGMLHQAQGNTALARKRYEEVVALDSHAAVAANNLAWLYAEAGENLDVALQYAQSAVAASPEVPEILDTLGWIYYKKNQGQLAIPLFKRCVEKAPENAGYHYHLGLAYLQTGDSDRGKASLERALTKNPDATTATEIRRALANPSQPLAGAR